MKVNMINIHKFINCHMINTDYYVNIDNGKIIEEYDYMILNGDKKEFIKIPQSTMYERNNMARSFLNNINENKYDNLLKSVSEEDYFDKFHCLMEEANLWDNFWDYREEKNIEFAIEWCKKNNFSYTLEKIKEKPITPEERIAELKKDTKRIEYYVKKAEKRLKDYSDKNKTD